MKSFLSGWGFPITGLTMVVSMLLVAYEFQTPADRARSTAELQAARFDRKVDVPQMPACVKPCPTLAEEFKDAAHKGQLAYQTFPANKKARVMFLFVLWAFSTTAFVFIAIYGIVRAIPVGIVEGVRDEIRHRRWVREFNAKVAARKIPS